MKKSLIKKAIACASLAIMMAPIIAIAPVSAQVDFGTNYAENLGLGDADPRDVAVNIVQVIMTFLGLIAVIIILIGGFKWMTASGSEDKVGEARKMIIGGVIGLAIILSAWAITTFVISQMTEVVAQ